MLAPSTCIRFAPPVHLTLDAPPVHLTLDYVMGTKMERLDAPGHKANQRLTVPYTLNVALATHLCSIHVLTTE